MYRGERFNSITHLIAFLIAVVGLVFLIVVAADKGDPWKIVSFTIYGSTLLLLFLCSVLCHSLRGKAEVIFCKLDHLSIYLLIAGTYTPFSLVTLRGAWGWSIFGVIWGLALIGIIHDLYLKQGKRIVPIILYLVMGWLIIIVVKPLLDSLPFAAIMWLLMGGILYTVGILFYVFDEKIPHFHGIWHLFVMAASFCHYFSIIYYVN